MSSRVNTHQAIDRSLCGEPLELGEGSARVALATRAEMAADETGLVHGGFVFGLADYAAMLAVNHPNVVLGRAQSRFVEPVAVGARLEAEAEVVERRGARQTVEVTVRRSGDTVFTGEFVCYVLEKHVLAERGGGGE